MSKLKKITRKVITITLTLALLFTMVNTNLLIAEAGTIPGRVIHFTVEDGNNNGVPGALVTVNYQRDGDNYSAQATTGADGKTQVTVYIGHDDKSFSYTVSKAGYGSVSGSRDANAWGANVYVNLGNIQSFNVTFNYSNDFAGTPQSQSVSVNYGQSAAGLAPNPERIGYNFTGWDSSLDNIQSNKVVNALYEIKQYNVTFLYSNDFEGTLASQSVIVNHGQSAAGLAPNAERVGYTFTGWNVSLDTITGDLLAIAVYELNNVEITFNYSNDFEGTPLSFYKVLGYGSDASGFAPDAERVGYTFLGWDAPINFVTSNLVVNAVYSLKTAFVTFVYGNTFEDNPITTVVPVGYAGSLTGNTPDPTRPGYTFLGWDVSLDNIRSDFTATALYEINEYSVNYRYKVGSDTFAITTEAFHLYDNLLDKAPGSGITNFETATIRYTLNGWFYDEALTEPVAAEDLLTVEENITLYGNYELDSIAYFYVLNPGLRIVPLSGEYGVNDYTNGIKLYGVLDSNYNGLPIFNSVNLENGVPEGTLTLGAIAPEIFITAAGEGSPLPADSNLIWYRVESNDGIWRVLGFVTGQIFYKEVNVEFYQESPTGTLLGSLALSVPIEAFGNEDGGLAEILQLFNINAFQSATSTAGSVESFDRELNLIKVVYTTIPAAPAPAPAPAPTPAPEAPIVIIEEAAPLAAAPLAAAPEVIPEEQVPLAAIVETVEPTPEEVVIPDEETPLADTPEVIEEEPEVTIEEPEVPLATLESDCWIHWLILALSLIYGAYGVIRGVQRNKKINELEAVLKESEA